MINLKTEDGYRVSKRIINGGRSLWEVFLPSGQKALSTLDYEKAMGFVRTHRFHAKRAASQRKVLTA